LLVKNEHDLDTKTQNESCQVRRI